MDHNEHFGGKAKASPRGKVKPKAKAAPRKAKGKLTAATLARRAAKVPGAKTTWLQFLQHYQAKHGITFTQAMQAAPAEWAAHKKRHGIVPKSAKPAAKK